MEGADDSTELWCPPYLSFRPLGLEAATSRPTVPKLQQEQPARERTSTTFFYICVVSVIFL